jgi:hypothetical protein
MVYFRVATRMDEASCWRWKSIVFTSLNTLFSFLRVHERVLKGRMRLFYDSSYSLLDEMLFCENSGKVSNSIMVEQFWRERGKIDAVEMMRLEVELVMRKSRQLVAVAAERSEHGPQTEPLEALPTIIIDDKTYDMPYAFTLPTSTRQVLAWARLLGKVQRGEIEL